MKIVHSHHTVGSTFVVIQHDHLFQVSTLLVQDGKLERSTALHLNERGAQKPDDEAVRLALAEHVKGLNDEIEKVEKYRWLRVCPSDNCDERIRELRASIKKAAKHA